MNFDAITMNRKGPDRGWSGSCAGSWALLLATTVLLAGVAQADSPDDAASAPDIRVLPEPDHDASADVAGGATASDQNTSPRSRADLEEAVRKAEEAADEAWRAARAADQRARDAERKHDQSGPYLGAAYAYAAENFDDSIIVKSSDAGSVFAGYRFESWFSAELRYEGFDGFDLKSPLGHGEIDGYAITINGKLRPFDGPIQPVMAIGMGGIRLDTETVLNGGARFDRSESEFVFRISGGIDLPVNEHLMLNLEAAYLLPDDDLSDLEIGMLSGGLTYVF